MWIVYDCGQLFASWIRIRFLFMKRIRIREAKIRQPYRTKPAFPVGGSVYVPELEGGAEEGVPGRLR